MYMPEHKQVDTAITCDNTSVTNTRGKFSNLQLDQEHSVVTTATGIITAKSTSKSMLMKSYVPDV